MAEELQNLLDRIQKEGVEKAESEAARIVSAARDKAAALVSEAEQTAAQTAEKAKREAEQLVERGRRSLEQAARDVVLSVGASIMGIFQELAAREAASALSGDTLKSLLVKVVEAYTARSATSGGMAVLLNPEDAKKLTDFLVSRFKAQAGKGIQVVPQDSVTAGFRVTLEGGRIQHDFSAQAIAEAMAELLRPQLAEIVRKAIPA